MSGVSLDNVAFTGGVRKDAWQSFLESVPDRTDPQVRQRLAQFYAEQTVKEINAFRASAARAQGDQPGPEGSINKILNAELNQRRSSYVVELAGLAPVAATPIAAFAGAVTSFNANRHFTYHGAAAVAVRSQLWRYALVSSVSLGLNTLGEYLFHHVWGVQYMLARVITSVIVSNAWNYPTMKYFVFSTGAGR